MTIRRMQRSGGTGRVLAVTLGLGVTAALTLSGCAQSDVGGSSDPGSGSASDATEAPEESPSPSPSEEGGAGDDGRLPEAAEMATTPGTSGRGLPPGLEGSTESPAGVAWAPDEGLLYVVTNGSSSCPTLAEPEATFGAGNGAKGGVAAADGVLTVQLLPEEDGICTMDFVPTTTVVEVPAEADTGEEIPVAIGDKGTVQLQPRPADGEPGPVAWLES